KKSGPVRAVKPTVAPRTARPAPPRPSEIVDQGSATMIGDTPAHPVPLRHEEEDVDLRAAQTFVGGDDEESASAETAAPDEGEDADIRAARTFVGGDEEDDAGQGDASGAGDFTSRADAGEESASFRAAQTFMDAGAADDSESSGAIRAAHTFMDAGTES